MGRTFNCCGLSKRAENLVKGASREDSERPEGCITLSNYRLGDGKVYEEHVQQSVDDSHGGELVFVALKNQRGNWITHSLWRDDEIGKLLGESYWSYRHEGD